jgi:peptidoglycan hydrolase FlgJ
MDFNLEHVRAPAEKATLNSIRSGERAKLKEACRDFESIFLKQMLNAMKKTVDKSELINGGMAEDLFEDMLYDEYAKIMAKTGSFGLADMMFRQLDGKASEPLQAGIVKL